MDLPAADLEAPAVEEEVTGPDGERMGRAGAKRRRRARHHP